MKFSYSILSPVLAVFMLFNMNLSLAQTIKKESDSNFDFSLHAGGLSTTYTDSDFRQSMTQFNESILITYKKYYGFNGGGSFTRYYFKDGVAPIYISSTYGKFFASLNSDILRGRLGLRAGVTNTQSFSRDSSNVVTTNNVVTSNNVVVLSGVLYYRSHGGFSLDYGLMTSRYFDVVDLSPIDVTQQNVTTGLSFNQGYDWLQYRATTIDIVATEDRSYSSHKLQYSHWFKANVGKSTVSMHASAITGKRQYGVVEETSVVYNYADVQQNTYSLGLIWKPKRASLSIFTGKAYYEKAASTDLYTSTYIYLAVGNDW